MEHKHDTFNDDFKLLFRYSGTIRPRLERSFVEGTVVAKNKHVYTVHTGLKTATQFIDKELPHHRGKDSNGLLNTIGSKVQLYLYNIENMDGDIVFNPHYYTQKVKAVAAWDRVHKLKYVKGIVLNTVNGGFSVGIGGIVAFLPRSRAKLPSTGKVEYVQSLMNNYRLYRIIKVNHIRKNIVVSLVPTSTNYKK